MSEYNVRATDSQITVQGRTFAVRHFMLGGFSDTFVVLELRGNESYGCRNWFFL